MARRFVLYLVSLACGASPRFRVARPPYRILLLDLLVTILGRLRPDVSVPRYHVSPDLVGLRPDPLVGLRPDFTCQKAV